MILLKEYKMHTFSIFLTQKNFQIFNDDDKSNKIKRIIFEIFISTLKFLKFQITQKKRELSIYKNIFKILNLILQ